MNLYDKREFIDVLGDDDEYYSGKNVKEFIKKVDKRSNKIYKVSIDNKKDPYERGFKAGWETAIEEFWEIVLEEAGKELLE